MRTSRLKKTTAFLATCAAALGIGLAGAGPAAALNQENCDGRTDLMMITRANGIKYCYANAGSNLADPAQGIYYISSISSGNNVVSVYGVDNVYNEYKTYHLNKNEAWHFSPEQFKVISYTIY